MANLSEMNLTDLIAHSNDLQKQMYHVKRALIMYTDQIKHAEIKCTVNEIDKYWNEGYELYSLEEWFNYPGHDEDGDCLLVIRGEEGNVTTIPANNSVYNHPCLSVAELKVLYHKMGVTHVIIETVSN